MTDQGGDTLSQEALELYREYVALGRRTVRAAWLAGQALNRARTHTEHGQWLTWLEGAGIARSSAYRIIGLFLEFPKGTSQLGKFASVTSALEEAAERRFKARRSGSRRRTTIQRLEAENDGPSLREAVEAGDAYPVVGQVGAGEPRVWFLKEGVVEVVRDGPGGLEILAESMGVIGEGYLPPAPTAAGGWWIASVAVHRLRPHITVMDLSKLEAFRRGSIWTIPPLVFPGEGGEYVIVDGTHRVAAAVCAGVRELRVVVGPPPTGPQLPMSKVIGQGAEGAGRRRWLVAGVTEPIVVAALDGQGPVGTVAAGLRALGPGFPLPDLATPR